MLATHHLKNTYLPESCTTRAVPVRLGRKRYPLTTLAFFSRTSNDIRHLEADDVVPKSLKLNMIIVVWRIAPDHDRQFRRFNRALGLNVKHQWLNVNLLLLETLLLSNVVVNNSSTVFSR